MGLRRLPFISHFVVFAVKLNQELQATTRAPRAPAELQGRTRATRTPTELQATTRAPRAPAELQGRTRSSVQLLHTVHSESHTYSRPWLNAFIRLHTLRACVTGAPELQARTRATRAPPELQGKRLTAPGIPRRSPIQVLTGPDLAWLPRSDEIGHDPGGMAVSHQHSLTRPPQPYGLAHLQLHGPPASTATHTPSTTNSHSHTLHHHTLTYLQHHHQQPVLHAPPGTHY